MPAREQTIRHKTSTPDKVRTLIERLAPEPICDDCIAEQLVLGSRQNASQSARELAGSAGFERGKNTCAMCQGLKMVTRKRSH